MKTKTHIIVAAYTCAAAITLSTITYQHMASTPDTRRHAEILKIQQQTYDDLVAIIEQSNIGDADFASEVKKLAERFEAEIARAKSATPLAP